MSAVTINWIKEIIKDESLRKLVVTLSKVFYILLGIDYMQCHILLNAPSRDKKKHLRPCLWNFILFHFFLSPSYLPSLTCFIFSYVGRFIFFTDLFCLPISFSSPFFLLNKTIRFTRKWSWGRLGVIIPYMSNWNYRMQDKIFYVDFWCFS